MFNESQNKNNNKMNELKEKKNDLIESFNKIALNMVTHLGNEFKDSIFGKSKTIIKNFFKFKPNETIIFFLESVYSYDDFRKKIKEGDERFFMEQSYEDAMNAGYEKRIFEFKDIWLRMNTQTKKIVKESMAMLIEHCELYLDIVSEINKLKKSEN
jgi:hypothetical protein